MYLIESKVSYVIGMLGHGIDIIGYVCVAYNIYGHGLTYVYKPAVHSSLFHLRNPQLHHILQYAFELSNIKVAHDL